jgi:hypothetical protein
MRTVSLEREEAKKDSTAGLLAVLSFSFIDISDTQAT